MDARGWCRLVLLGLVACHGGATTTTTTTATAPPATPTTAPATTSAPAAAASGARDEPARLLATVDVAPGLAVTAHAGSLYDGTSCWTFVTHGLAARAHPELVLSLTLRAGDTPDAYPQDAIDFLRNLSSRIPDVRLDPWASASLGRGVLGRDDLVGVAAVPAEGPRGVALPDGAVTLLLLTREETEVARVAGAARIAAVIGRHYRYYPTAWWLDRDRASLVAPGALAQGVPLGGGTRVAGLTSIFDFDGVPTLDPGGTALPSGAMASSGHLRIRVTPDGAAALASRLRGVDARASLVALIAPDDLAGGRFVWVPGSSSPETIAGPGLSTHVSGSFIVFSVHPSVHGAALIEDGVSVVMSPAQLAALIAALAGGQPVAGEPTSAGMMAWQLEWASTGPPKPKHLKTIGLGIPDDELGQRAAVADLVTFVNQVDAAVDAAVTGARPKATTLWIDVVLQRGGARTLALTVDPPGDPAWLTALRKRLDAIPPVAVGGDVPFRLELSL